MQVPGLRPGQGALCLTKATGQAGSDNGTCGTPDQETSSSLQLAVHVSQATMQGWRGVVWCFLNLYSGPLSRWFQACQDPGLVSFPWPKAVFPQTVGSMTSDLALPLAEQEVWVVC